MCPLRAYGLIVGAGPRGGSLILGVAMEATASRITAERYFEISVEGDRTQLVDGVLVMDEPRLIHGALEAEIVGVPFLGAQGEAARRAAEAELDQEVAHVRAHHRLTVEALDREARNAAAPDRLRQRLERLAKPFLVDVA